MVSSDYKQPKQILIKGMLDIPGQENIRRVYDVEGLSPCLTTMEGGNRQPKIEVRACLTPDRIEKRQNGRRFKEPGEPMFTLTKQDIHGIMQGYRIRKLTPKECWRLQGVADEITDKVIKAGISDSQMYRGSGDACTVNVIYEIAKKLI
jgi:DNA (cytosine-5)-methyltransferase 1